MEMIQKNAGKSKGKRLTLREKNDCISFMLSYKSERDITIKAFSEKTQISRQSMYTLAKKFKEEFRDKQPGPKTQEVAQWENNAEYLMLLGGISKKIDERTQKRLLSTILELGVKSLCANKIKEVIRSAFELEISHKRIRKILRYYGRKASNYLFSMPVEEHVKNLEIDEVFSGKNPVLTGVEPKSMAVVICKKEDSRDHSSWQRALGSFNGLELVISDQAKGIEKAIDGKELVSHQYDLFHIKRDLGRLVRKLESQAYKKIEQEYKSRSRWEKSRTDEEESQREIIYRSREEESSRVVALFDELEKCFNIISKCLEIFDSSGKIYNIGKNLKKLFKAVNRAKKATRNKKVIQILNRLSHVKTTRYLKVLNEKIMSCNLLWKQGEQAMPRQKVVEIIARYHYQNNKNYSVAKLEEESQSDFNKRRRKIVKAGEMGHLGYLMQIRILQMSMRNFEEVYAEISQALENICRSSSLVESFNSQVRICQQNRKQLDNDLLSLVVLKWNTTPFLHGKRKGKSPYEILGVNFPSSHWLQMLLD